MITPSSAYHIIAFESSAGNLPAFLKEYTSLYRPSSKDKYIIRDTNDFFYKEASIDENLYDVAKHTRISIKRDAHLEAAKRLMAESDGKYFNMREYFVADMPEDWYKRFFLKEFNENRSGSIRYSPYTVSFGSHSIAPRQIHHYTPSNIDPAGWGKLVSSSDVLDTLRYMDDLFRDKSWVNANKRFEQDVHKEK